MYENQDQHTDMLHLPVFVLAPPYRYMHMTTPPPLSEHVAARHSPSRPSVSWYVVNTQSSLAIKRSTVTGAGLGVFLSRDSK